MLRAVACAVAMICVTLSACGTTGYAVRPVARIAADSVGQPVVRLQEAFGAPRKIDTGPTKLIYVWFLEDKPPGTPLGFHGCEIEVAVEPRTERVLGYSMSDVGWAKCSAVVRKIRVAER